MKQIKAPEAEQLPSGSWRCRVLIDGRRVSVTADTKKAAEKEAMRVKIEHKRVAQVMTLKNAYEKYIDSRKDVLSPSTVAGYTRLSRNTYQSIMSLNIGSLTNDRIQREINAMHRDGKSQKYISNANGLLSSVLKQFRPDFQLNVRLPQKERYEQRMISPEEISAIFESVKGTEVELPVYMAVWMGMRMSEIIGAKKSDIKDGKLHIHTAIVTDVNGNLVAKPPKTFSGDRYVPVPSRIMEMIDQVEGEQIVTLSNQAIYKRFVRCIEKAGIPHCRFHDLRHANAAVLVMLGVESKYAQQRNGWNTEHMYKKVYAYVMQEQMDKDTELIDNYFESII